MTPVRLYWWRQKFGEFQNFGDELSPLIVEQATGRSVVRAELASCDMMAIGSVLGFLQKYTDVSARREQICVWGAGTIEAATVDASLFKFLAVRGPYTKSVIAGHSDRVPFGDPALLCSVLWPVSTLRTRSEFRVGIVPHHSHIASERVTRLVETIPGAVLIDVRQAPLEVVRMIASSEIIISSSLHGLIVADSYSVPNAWLDLGPIQEGGTWKFLDYFASVGRPYMPLGEEIFDPIQSWEGKFLFTLSRSKFGKVQRALFAAASRF